MTDVGVYVGVVSVVLAVVTTDSPPVEAEVATVRGACDVREETP